MVTDLKVVEDEKSKEVNHLKKISSLKKSCEALEAQVKDREKKIDNLRSTLLRTPHNVVENYKASSKYQHDLYAYRAVYECLHCIDQRVASGRAPECQLPGFRSFLSSAMEIGARCRAGWSILIR
ncbi:hypothetical protein Fot_37648 [Forsythia ovata]|uniref:Uncharacterized protein n=1 Tax=Forsythia ovata TaxID=205694 RepID=A0ABD1S0B5_9LAMI